MFLFWVSSVTTECRYLSFSLSYLHQYIAAAVLTWCLSMVQVTVMKTLMEREKWLAHSSTSYTGPGYITSTQTWVKTYLHWRTKWSLWVSPKALRYCGWDCKIIFIDYFLKGLTDSQTRGAVSLGIEACENHKLGVSRKLNIFILAVKNTPENHKVWFWHRNVGCDCERVPIKFLRFHKLSPEANYFCLVVYSMM